MISVFLNFPRLILWPSMQSILKNVSYALEKNVCFEAFRGNVTSKEWRLCRRRRAKRSYPTFKVRRGNHEEIPLVQGKKEWLHFAGAAVKRHPMSKVRETQVRW